MRRREFIWLLGGAAAWPLTAGAQQSGKVYRIAYFSAGIANPVNEALLKVLRESLHALGWSEGKNLVFEYRYAENRLDRLPELATIVSTLQPRLGGYSS
jgi:putative tryptophan/tyrosine transport system substrate-binding protein